MKKLITAVFCTLLVTGMFAQDNSSATTQTGDDNEAYIVQTGSNNEAIINQAGNTNYGWLRSRGDDVQKIEQIGDENIGTVNSEGANEATIMQNGNRNIAGSIPFTGPKGIRQFCGTMNKALTNIVEGDENITFVDQLGNENETLIKLGEWGPANMNEVNFLQTGDGNYLETIMNSAENNVVNATQDGNDNYFRVMSITRSTGNLVNMLATGDANRGSWGISGDHPESSDDNILNINQLGNSNKTAGEINGDLNTVDIIQTGDGNMVGSDWYIKDGVNITGDANDVNIMQNGTGNSSLNTIVGNNNLINVSQND